MEGKLCKRVSKSRAGSEANKGNRCKPRFRQILTPYNSLPSELGSWGPLRTPSVIFPRPTGVQTHEGLGGCVRTPVTSGRHCFAFWFIVHTPAALRIPVPLLLLVSKSRFASRRTESPHVELFFSSASSKSQWSACCGLYQG